VRSLTLDEALHENPVGWFQYRLLLMCGLAFMADALEVSLLSFLATCAGADWGLSTAQEASITSVVFGGIICGTMFWGVFADKYGRKMAYLAASTLITVGGILSGASPSYGWLIFFRCIAGFGIGGASVPFDLLAEFMPASHRGRFLIYIEYFWTIGSMFVAGLAWATLNERGWRFLAYATAIPVAVASVVSYFYLPESPRWLLIKGKATEAEEVVRAAALVNGVVMEPFRLVDVTVDESSIKDASYIDLLRDKEAMRTSIPLWIVWAMFGFTYYGIILFVGRLYSTDDDDGSDDKKCSFDYQSIFINSTAEVFGCTMGALCIDRFGRVKSQTFFYLLAGFAVFLMGFETGVTAVMVVGFMARIGALAASNATWVTTPELYSTEMRTVGHSTCVAISKFGSFAAPYLVISSASDVTVGIVLCAMNVIGAVAANFLPDTTNMKMDQVDTLRSSRVSFDAKEGARHSKDGWFTGPGGGSSAEVLNALRLDSYPGGADDTSGLLAPLNERDDDGRF